MTTISNINVYGLVQSVLASGYAMMIDPYEVPLDNIEENDTLFDKGLKRLVKLNQASKGEIKCHNHALCGITVDFDIRYPQYISPELQRYKFLDIVTSSSKMHRLLKMNINKSCNKYVSQSQIDTLQKDIDRYNNIDSLDWTTPREYKFVLRNGEEIISTNKNDALYQAWMICINDCPMGLELFMRCHTNYLCLQNMYFQRRHHRLRDDWGAICKMIEGLPYAKQLIFGEN